jgi:hypothetical protein
MSLSYKTAGVLSTQKWGCVKNISEAVNPADHLDIVTRVVRRTRGLVPWVDQSDLEGVAHED